MRSMKTAKRRRVDESSLKNLDMDFLVNEAVDRSMFETARDSITPLSEIMAVASKFGTMPGTTAAIRSTIKKVTDALSARPDPLDQILSAAGLDTKQKALVNAVTDAEVLKFSILNGMDAGRLLILNEFKKDSIRFYTDEALEFRLVIRGPGVPIFARDAITVPFATITRMGDFEIYYQDDDCMVIGAPSANRPRDVNVIVPGYGTWRINDVTSDKIYLVGRDSSGDPIPTPLALKQTYKRLRAAPSRGSMDQKVKTISGFDVDVVKNNFKVPAPAEGAVVSIYRAIRGTSAVPTPGLAASTFANEVAELKLEEFKELFEKVAESTTNSTGDVVSYDSADVLFFAGLSAISGLLGTTRPGTPPPSPGGGGGTGGGGGGSPGGGGGPGGGPGDGGGGPVVRHSLSNILLRPSVMSGRDQTERETNLRLINQDNLRRELNSLTGGRVIFTEGALIDRWCELAGIKESK